MDNIFTRKESDEQEKEKNFYFVQYYVKMSNTLIEKDFLDYSRNI